MQSEGLIAKIISTSFPLQIVSSDMLNIVNNIVVFFIT